MRVSIQRAREHDVRQVQGMARRCRRGGNRGHRAATPLPRTPVASGIRLLSASPPWGAARLAQPDWRRVLLAVSALPAAVGPRILYPSAAVKPALPLPTPSPSATPPPVQAAAGPPAPLSLDMAVGQMMAASFGGPVITAGLRHLIVDEKVGTVLIFRDNFTDVASLGRLTAQLQALGREAGLPAPLLVAVDEEGDRKSGV